ncbi:alpha/beta fold hydrolase [Nonomuraea sp. NPDC049309]|uniref:alpha/beta fold hydrolase n=1 Tax=Nonomuraea sp. NPDC049309 TaxID=3364350 RepID=UPI00371467D2
MTITPPGATLPGITHHRAEVNGTALHYVAAGTGGSPILLIHGFPETWWTFHKLIPLLAAGHRVFAADLRGFGDSGNGPGTYDSATSAEDLHRLIAHLGVGPVHVTGQDISGATVFRLATTHPEDVLSLTAIEMGLAGFGLEALADVTRGGAWHIGVLAAPGVPELLLAGREREFLGGYAFPSMTAVGPRGVHGRRSRRVRPRLLPAGRLARRDRPLPVDAARGSGDPGPRRVSRAAGARAGGRRRRRLVHGGHPVAGRGGRGHVRAARRGGALRRDGGPRGAGGRDPRLHRRRRRRWMPGVTVSRRWCRWRRSG